MLTCIGCGGNTSGPSIPVAQQDDESIKIAKQSDFGKKLKNGETKEFRTVFNPVIVTKDQSGNLTYQVKK